MISSSQSTLNGIEHKLSNLLYERLVPFVVQRTNVFIFLHKGRYINQGGITCGAIDEPRKSSKAIDERVIINFRDKNGVIARFRDKNVVIVRFCDKNVECLYIYYGVIEE